MFRVSSLPYSFWTFADYDDTATDPKRLFSNRTGSEIAALQAICKVNGSPFKITFLTFSSILKQGLLCITLKKLNCQYEFYNTIDVVWGSVWEGGASGQFAELRDDNVDIALGNLVVAGRNIVRN